MNYTVGVQACSKIFFWLPSTDLLHTLISHFFFSFIFFLISISISRFSFPVLWKIRKFVFQRSASFADCGSCTIESCGSQVVIIRKAKGRKRLMNVQLVLYLKDRQNRRILKNTFEIIFTNSEIPKKEWRLSWLKNTLTKISCNCPFNYLPFVISQIWQPHGYVKDVPVWPLIISGSPHQHRECVQGRSGNAAIWQHGLINYTDNKAKCRHLKKLTCKGTFRQVFFRE